MKGENKRQDPAVDRMAGLLFNLAAELQCVRLDLVDRSAPEDKLPSLEIAEAAIARARMRGID